MSSIVVPSFCTSGYLKSKRSGSGSGSNLYFGDSRDEDLEGSWETFSRKWREENLSLANKQRINPNISGNSKSENVRIIRKQIQDSFPLRKRHYHERQDGESDVDSHFPKQNKVEAASVIKPIALDFKNSQFAPASARGTPSSETSCGFSSASESTNHDFGFPTPSDFSRTAKGSRFGSDSDDAASDLDNSASSTRFWSDEDDANNPDFSSTVCEAIAASLKRKLFNVMEELVQKSTETVLENFRKASDPSAHTSGADREKEKVEKPLPVEAPEIAPRYIPPISSIAVQDNAESYRQHLKTSSRSQLCFGDVQVGAMADRTSPSSLLGKDDPISFNSLADDVFAKENSRLSSDLKSSRFSSSLGTDVSSPYLGKSMNYYKMNNTFSQPENLLFPTKSSHYSSSNNPLSNYFSSSLNSEHPIKQPQLLAQEPGQNFPISPFQYPLLSLDRSDVLSNFLQSQKSSNLFSPFRSFDTQLPLRSNLSPTIQRMAYLNSLTQRTAELKRDQGWNKLIEKRAKDFQEKQSTTNYVKIGRRINKFSIHNCEGLTSNHLKKAKLMFFYVRYPTASTIQPYFENVQFTRATTSQLIKWFSNFREFFYNQIEKFARKAIKDGVTNVEQLQVARHSELFRILQNHFNKANNFEVPESFSDVVLISLKEFFIAIQSGKDKRSSWKKPIYKIMCKHDEEIPDRLKSFN